MAVDPEVILKKARTLFLEQFSRLNPLKTLMKEKFDFLFSCALWGISLFAIFADSQITKSYPKEKELLLYLEGWLFFPIIGLLCGNLLKKFRRRFLKKSEMNFLPFVFTNSLFVLAFLFPEPWNVFSAKYFTMLFWAAQVVALWIMQSLNSSRFLKKYFTPNNVYCVLSLLYFVWAIHNKTDWSITFKNLTFYHYLFCAGLLVSFYFNKALLIQKLGKYKKWYGFLKSFIPFLFYGIAIKSIFHLVMDPYFLYDDFHYSFYLGPLADLMNGKALLVNITAQYGVMVFYFLKFIFNFLPLGFSSFCLVITILYMLQYFLFYMAVREVFRKEILAFFCLMTLLLVNYLDPIERLTSYPSVGPLRFGFIYVLMALVVFRNRFNGMKKIFLWAEALLMGMAAFWSIDVAVYTLPGYAGLLIFESFDFADGFHFNLKRFVQRIALLTGGIVLVGIYLYADTYIRSHQFPQWRVYLDLINYYNGGFGLLPTPAKDLWWLLIGTYYFSLFMLAGILMGVRGKKLPPENLNVIVLVTFYGISSFLYYLERSEPTNLYHVSMPCIFLITYWLYYLGQFNTPSVPVTVRKFLRALVILTLGFELLPLVTDAEAKLKKQFLPWPLTKVSILGALKDKTRNDILTKNAEILMKKYSGDQKQLVYFLGDYGLLCSMYNGRSKLYPFNDIIQADFCPAVRDRVENYDPQLKIGDYVYIGRTLFRPDYTIEQRTIEKLYKKYELKEIETDPATGITVLQVLGRLGL